MKRAALCLLLVFFVHGCNAGPLAPSRLRLEYLREPLGVDVQVPRFSWALQHTDRAEGQTAYRITVASVSGISLKNAKRSVNSSLSRGAQAEIGLSEDGAVLTTVWDSGLVKTGQSTNVEYGGETLKSDTVYMWTVYYLDNKGSQSPSSQAFFSTGLLRGGADWDPAQWLDGEKGNQLRTTFTLDNNVSVNQAFCYVVGMGYYKLQINGELASDHVLGPFTTFEKRIHYYTHDVTDFIQPGTNAIAVTLGNGWYSQKSVNVGGRLLHLKCSLHLSNDKQMSILSSTDWKQTAGPIVLDDIYIGETFNASMETRGWDMPDFDDSSWSKAVALQTTPTSELSSPMMPPPRKVQTYTAISLSEPAPGVYVFDFGQNMAGFCTLTIHSPVAPTSANVSLLHAEMMREDGFVQHRYGNSPEIATYIFDGQSERHIAFEPSFTYFGFRYVQMTGFPGTPSLTTTLVAHFVHTDMEMTGNIEFAPNGHILNQVQHITRFASLSNYIDIPTDCPQRERRGWLGDAQLSAETTIYNFDMAASYTKFLRDIRDTQAFLYDQAKYKGAVPDCVPWYHHGGLPADPAWGTAYTLILDWMVRFNDDQRLLNMTYKGAVEHIDSLMAEAEQPQGLLTFSRYGDWCSLQHGNGCGKHSALVSSFYYIMQLDIMGDYAMQLGQNYDAKRFAVLAAQLRGLFQTKFFDTSAKEYKDDLLDVQTAHPLALQLGNVVEAGDVEAVLAKLVSDITNKSFHLDTGIVGTKYLLPILSQYGHHDVAMEIASQTSFPSWGYMVAQGATTLWENWQGTHFKGVGSRNHIMFGSQSSWYYQSIAGINLAPRSAGWQKILIAPQVATTGSNPLEGVDASIITLRGRVSSLWALYSGRVCVTADENQQATLSCSGPNDHIVSIDFASYGTPTGTCGNFSTFNCSSQNSQAVVSKACVGKQSCTISVTNTAFGGDPCFDVVKHLDIQATCTTSQPLSMEVEIPGGSQAEVRVPLVNGLTNTTATVMEGSATVWKDGKFQEGDAGVTAATGTALYISFEVGSGSYTFYLMK